MNDILTFFDFETTGLRNPQPVSLAFVSYKDGKKIYGKYTTINPLAKIEPAAQKIHGISQEDVKDSITFEKLWEEIKPYFSGCTLVGHNVDFDAGVLKKAVTRFNLDCEDFETICTCANARKIVSGVPNYKLSTLCDYFDIVLDHAHDARDDVMGCIRVYNKLVDISNGNLEKKLFVLH